MATDKLFETLNLLNDAELLAVLIGSLKNRKYKGIELPGFAPDAIQSNFGGSSGEHTLDGLPFLCRGQEVHAATRNSHHTRKPRVGLWRGLGPDGALL